MKRYLMMIGTLALAGCTQGVPGPTGVPGLPDPGSLRVVLTTPHTDDGALLIHVTGGPVDSVTSAGGYAVYDAAAGTNERRIIVEGDIENGVVATIWVQDRRTAASYSVTLEQAAARGSFHQQSPDGYQLSLTSGS
jgi:hypothetical protein